MSSSAAAAAAAVSSPASSTSSSSSSSLDPIAQMKLLTSHLQTLNDLTAKDEAKLKAAQELSDNFDAALASQHYPQFLDMAMKVFLKILQEGRPHFIAEYNVQQVRHWWGNTCDRCMY